MSKYHINPETGVPGLCTAEYNCKFAGASEHYDFPKLAMEAFEKRMEKEKIAKPAKKKPAPSFDDDKLEDWEVELLGYCSECGAKTNGTSNRHLKRCSQNPDPVKVTTVKPRGTVGTLSPTTTGVHPISRPRGSSSSGASFAGLPNHSAPSVIKEVMMNGKGLNKWHENVYAVHSGRMNPTSGDGDTFGNWDSGVSVILGEANGARARVMTTSSQDSIQTLNDTLGAPVTMIKQQKNVKDTSTPNLHILGYVHSEPNPDPKGPKFIQTKIGYVPDKRIHYFVAK